MPVALRNVAPSLTILRMPRSDPALNLPVGVTMHKHTYEYAEQSKAAVFYDPLHVCGRRHWLYFAPHTRGEREFMSYVFKNVLTFDIFALSKKVLFRVALIHSQTRSLSLFLYLSLSVGLNESLPNSLVPFNPHWQYLNRHAFLRQTRRWASDIDSNFLKCVCIWTFMCEAAVFNLHCWFFSGRTKVEKDDVHSVKGGYKYNPSMSALATWG